MTRSIFEQAIVMRVIAMVAGSENAGLVVPMAKRAMRFMAGFMVFLMALLFARVAYAQVPPHYPGTICFTPYFWCWAQPPGQPGVQCGCPGPYGWVLGFLG